MIQEAKHPEVMIFKNYTPIDLLPFDGHGKEGRILMAVNGSIYDVTRGRNFYGPGNLIMIMYVYSIGLIMRKHM